MKDYTKPQELLDFTTTEALLKELCIGMQEIKILLAEKGIK